MVFKCLEEAYVLIHVFVELAANRLQVVIVNIREALANVDPKREDVIACKIVCRGCWFMHRVVACGAANARSTRRWGRCEGDVCARIGRNVFLVEAVAHSGRRRTEREIAQIDLPVNCNGGCFGKHDLCPWLSPSAGHGWRRLHVDLNVFSIVHVVVELVRSTAVVVGFQIKVVIPSGPVQRFEVISTRG
jgi:hypothetical protein